MRNRALCLGLAIFTILCLSLPPWGGPACAAEKEPPLVHVVYFSLNDSSPAARTKLVDACRKYLSGHPGCLGFAVGVRAAEFQRDVNDQDFDVTLHVVFESKAAHDKYQKAERHLKFIEENKESWKKVRVFDAYVLAGEEASPDSPSARSK
jgi:hypothetical protein